MLLINIESSITLVQKINKNGTKRTLQIQCRHYMKKLLTKNYLDLGRLFLVFKDESMLENLPINLPINGKMQYVQ